MVESFEGTAPVKEPGSVLDCFRDALERKKVRLEPWWDWDRGSASSGDGRRSTREEIRDGLGPRFNGPAPTMTPQSAPRDASVARAKARSSTSFVSENPRLHPRCRILSLRLMSNLSVAKGDDIRDGFDALEEQVERGFVRLHCSALATKGSDGFEQTSATRCGQRLRGKCSGHPWLHEDLRPYCEADMTHQYPGRGPTAAKQRALNCLSLAQPWVAAVTLSGCSGCPSEPSDSMLGDHTKVESVFH
jgi:hypothetical protein